MTLAEATTLLLKEASQLERRAPRYGFSNAGGCARQHVYEFREFEETGTMRPVPTPLRWVYQNACGHAIGAVLEAAARRLGWQTQVPVRWEVDGILIEGSADIVAPHGFVIDGKYVSLYKWRSVQTLPVLIHAVQVQGYAFVLEQPAAGLLYQRFTEKGEDVPFLLHEMQTSQNVAWGIVSHWLEVDRHRKAGTLPARGFAQDSFECNTCLYAKECWNES